jgi:hypothetical protein
MSDASIIGKSAALRARSDGSVGNCICKRTRQLPQSSSTVLAVGPVPVECESKGVYSAAQDGDAVVPCQRHRRVSS